MHEFQITFALKTLSQKAPDWNTYSDQRKRVSVAEKSRCWREGGGESKRKTEQMR